MDIQNKIAPCLWFEHQAETAARYYTDIFPDSKLGHIARYSEVGQEIHGKAPGSVLTVDFIIAGQAFTALNGGPQFQFSEAISLQIYCDDQAEIDHYWQALTEGGREQPCGWCKDRFGVSWQVVPRSMLTLMEQGTVEQIDRMMTALFEMSKLDVAALESAFYGH